MPVCTMCGTTYGATVRICVHDGTPLVADHAHDPYVGTLLDGKYRIDTFINAGGMGSLYRGVHVMLDKTVAVKVIKNELVTSDEIVARFQREARAASNLHHPNIVSVYDLGQTPEGTLYIAMEFIEGSSLKEVIRRDGPLTPRDSIDILRQVASALSSAHRKHIVHRDLKSDNLMLASEDGRTVVKLVDFGIAKTFDDSTQLTHSGFMLGTPSYMSPEQAAGKEVDHRTDLYSLGVILYEMLTGKVPFGDSALTSLLVRLATEVPPPPSARRPDGQVPPALDAVAMRCLEKDPERRFQSANEFISALDSASAEIKSVGAAPAASIPAVEKTLVTPPHMRQVATPAASPHVSVAPAAPDTSASRTGRNVAVLLVLVVAVAAAAIAGGLLLKNNFQSQKAPSATTQQPAPPPAPTPAAPAPVQAPATQETNLAPAPAPAVQPTSIDDGRGRVPPRSENTSRSPAPPAVQSQPKAVPPPRADAIDRTPAAVAQTPSPAASVTTAPPAPVTPAPTPTPTQPARSAPSVTVTCQGVPDVCDVIRSEIVRAFQDNRVTDEVEIAIKAAIVAERPSNQVGIPSTIRTYSVELRGRSRGAEIIMPLNRAFESDPLRGRGPLEAPARELASAAVQAVRAFSK